MKLKKYETLKEQYPEYVSLDQFYRICGIAKRSALYLIQHEIIPSLDTGKRTWRYKIALDDVITYLRRREQIGSMIPAGAVSSRKKHPGNQARKCFAEFVRPGTEQVIMEYFDFIYSEYPDVLTAKDIAEMTGLNVSTIIKWIQAGEIKALRVSCKYMVPKEYLLEFIVTPKFFDSKSNSESFKKILGGFEIWKISKRGTHERGDR